MKANIFVAVLLLFCLGCTSQQSDQLTQGQKHQIKKEVKAVVNTFFAKAEKLDAGCFDCYADSPDWGMVNADGSRYDYQTTKKTFLDFTDSSTAWKWTTTHQDFIFLAKDVVIYACDGKDENILKSGDKITYDPHAYTIIFKKIGGQWKVIYQHDSGVAVIQKAAKK